MKNYESLARQLLNDVGGETNVKGVTHCLTRLRFTLKDRALVNTESLQNHPDVMAIVEAGGQYQIVIGNHVADVYDTLLRISDLQNRTGGEESTKVLDRFINMVSGIFQPTMGVLAATGMLKGIVAMMAFYGFNAENSGLYLLLEATGDGFFQFLPMILAVNASKYFNLNQFTGLALAAALLYPSLNTGRALPSAIGLSLSVPMGGYYQTVLPIIVAVSLAAQVEKWLKPRIPDVVKYFMVPFVTLLVVAPLTILLVGPSMVTLSQMIGQVFQWIYDFSPTLMGFVLGGLWQFLVILGLHWGLIPLMTIQLQTNGFSTILAMVAFVNFSQLGSILSIYLKSKEAKTKRLVLPSAVSAFFGITEPAIYGISLPMRWPFVLSSLGGAIQGAFIGWAGAHTYQMGGLGLFALTTFVVPDGSGVANLLKAVTALLLATVSGFLLTSLLKFPETVTLAADFETKTSEKNEVTKGQYLLKSPVDGDVVLLEEIADPVFASGAMGQGIAIQPTNDFVSSPVKGKVTSIFPTNHALSLLSDKGLELLIHLGTDTVQLNGEGFERLVAVGDEVEVGQPLIHFDRERIQVQGYDLTTAIIVTNANDYFDVLPTIEGDVRAGDLLLTVIE
ncbi:beta-glucoside-specific PTS transporter subunit IIABC [Streptococcus moroccensis]|uniref:PTS system beta-glucosides-specific IIC component n=1 Tax=Streptococcus moroccensis TaxID=1451356 RepID=A0ABT9YR55_9STRE|nr:beta-glucoside-specific PTS transporter subunit IIABC [Streptococcus moroccensis]MDQ0222082.1 PTS system beta-glucosides-specific IIC component [Streptococcus moroccensis]